jgi:hypothetical protein
LPTVKIRDPHKGESIDVRVVEGGSQLMRSLGQALMTHQDYPEPKSEIEAELLGQFMQNTNDYRDIWEDIGAEGRIRAEFEFTQELTSLRAAGFTVNAGLCQKVIEGGIGDPASCPAAYLVIRGSDMNSESVASTRLASN